jgi:putative membrane protein insertion efficiency factor
MSGKSQRTGPVGWLLIAIVRVYRYSLSAFIGRSCRHLPSCSEFTEDAIRMHGAWAGGWMGFARICRCRPGGTSGLDFVCDAVPEAARWWTPWRYGLWNRTNETPPNRGKR